MAETAADIKTTMDAIRDYLDRLYFTATFNAKTVGMLASNPGFPLWAKNNTQSLKRALGQYVSGGKAHSAVSGQAGAPSWVGAATEGPTSTQFDFGFEDANENDYQDPGGRAKRFYYGSGDPNTSVEGDETYQIEDLDRPLPTDNVDVMIDNIQLAPNIGQNNYQSWTFHWTKTSAGNSYFRSLDYPPRHAFALGRMFYGARGDTTKRGYFEDAETETGFLKDIYHVMYGTIVATFDDLYMLDPNTWKDTQITMSGDGTTAVPNGLDSNGAYFYPHESKLRGKVLFGVVPVIGPWIDIFSSVVWGQMLIAIHHLRKYRDPQRHIPILGGRTAVQVADDAYGLWIANVGMPGATDVFAGTPWSDTGSSFVTAVYSVLTTLLGYGSGIGKYKTRADDAITVLRKAVWGISPNNNSQKGYVDVSGSKVEWTRPEHTGGVLSVWKRDASDGKFYFVNQTSIGQLIAGALLEPRNLSNLYQTTQDPNTIPTNMEGSALAWLAMRNYLAYAYNDDYPDSTWANGLDLLSGFISGKVVKDSDGTVISGADVILVKGNQTANPQSLTTYVARTTTDSDGYYSLPCDVSGDHTVYVVKSGYKHMYKSYNIGGADQNLVFPEARMVTV